jgi:ribosomal subunit interface protein
MSLKFNFKSMNSSAVLEDYATRKLLPKISKYLRDVIQLNLTFKKYDDTSYVAVAHLVGSHGVDVRLSESQANMFAAVDTLAERMERVLRRRKEKVKTHKFKDFKATRALMMGKDSVEESTSDWIDAAEVISFEKARQQRAAAMHG